MLFTYTARKSPTEMLSGTIEADNAQVARAKLKRLGYFPVAIERRRQGGANPLELFTYRVSARDLALLARQLGTLLGSGVGLSEALSLVSAQVHNTRLGEALKDIEVRVAAGETLHDAMSGHRRLFPPFLVSVVAAGEAGGMLAEVFDRAAEHYEAIEQLRGKIGGALVYPAFLLLVGGISVAVLVTFVVPRFAELFAGVGQALPLPTRMLLAVSGFAAAWWWAVLVAAAGLAAGLHYATRDGAGRMVLDSIKLEIPLYGGIIMKVETARFARTLSSLLENGVPMLGSLDVVADTLGNRKIAGEVRKVREAVEQGSALGEALRRHTRFADMAFSMVRVGESSGATPEMLDKIASVYQREVDRAASAMTTVLEPVLILVMGGCVAFIVISILLPVFRLETLVH